MAVTMPAVSTGHVGPTVQTAMQPGWDGQIVPALRQRLVKESAQLSSRLSTSFPDDGAYGQAYQTGAPSAPPGQAASSGSTFIAQRQRTTSTPLGSSAPTPSRIPQPTAYRAAHAQLVGETGNGRSGSASGYQRSRGLNGGGGGASRSNPPIRPSTGSRQNSTGSNSSHGHAQRAHARVSPDKRPVALSRGNSSQGHGGDNRYLQPSSVPDGQRATLSNRDSFDLSSSNLPDVSIRNELPPFRMDPAEAMRIAQRGHVRDDDDDSGYGGEDGSGVDDDGFVDRSREGYRSRREDGRLDELGVETPRKRSERMSPVMGLASADSKGSRSRQAGGFAALGKGTPSSATRKTTAGGSKRNATGPSSASKPTSNAISSSSRSASLNLLSSSTSSHHPSGSTSAPGSRIGGVAAHLVPPESSFTPPKNANWDDVVLPAVAKKIALGNSTSSNAREREGEEGEDMLAVEWDKDGVPIKWAKASAGRGPRSRPGIDTAGAEDGPSGSTIKSGAGSAFSPTFEPSPDNPMYPSYPAPPLGVRQDSNHEYTGAYDGQPYADTATMRQYALSQGQYGDHHSQIPPSPAPFAQYGHPSPSLLNARHDKENLSPHMLQHQQWHASFRSYPNRQASHPSLRHQGSHASFGRHSAAHGQGMVTPVRDPGAMNADGGELGWQVYPTIPASEGRKADVFKQGGIEGGKGKKGKEGEHGKGCGCVIM